MERMRTMEQYEFYRNEERTVFLFSADWCPDCRFIEPFMPAIEADYPEFTFVYVDRDDFIDLCGVLDIFGIPSFLIFNKGEEVARLVSKDKKTKEEIEAFLDSVSL